jgi:hypothetical protein
MLSGMLSFHPFQPMIGTRKKGSPKKRFEDYFRVFGK